MWMMKGTSWDPGLWSSPKPSSFCTHESVMPSGGHTSACDVTATIPTCFPSRVGGAVRQGRVRSLVPQGLSTCLLSFTVN